jgi:transposase
MSYSYLNWDPNQVALLPADPRDWLPNDHLAYEIFDIVQSMDLSALKKCGWERRGVAGFDPRMLFCIVLYSVTLGVFSCRRMASLCQSDLGARYLCGGSPLPKYRVLGKFRQLHDGVLSGVLAQTVTICKHAGLVDVSDRFLDGTKIKANAGLGKNRTYASVCKEIEHLTLDIESKLKQGAAEDALLDATEGDDGDGDGDGDGEARKALKAKLERRSRFTQAKLELEARAKVAREEYLATPVAERSHHKAPTGTPADDDRINMTDPESRIMRTRDKAFMQALNGQILVEPKSLIIVDAFVSNSCNDYSQLSPALRLVGAEAAASASEASAAATSSPNSPGEVSQESPASGMRLAADAGYRSLSNLTEAQEAGIEVFIPAGRENRQSVFVSEEMPPAKELGNDLAKLMDAKLATQEGHDFFAQRKCTVEAVFAMIKGCGNCGMRQFLRRGLEKCQKDWLLICAAHNLKRYIACRRPKQETSVKLAAKNSQVMA